MVYINTSLLTKATADALVPTITCTSSNVVQTILQAFAQVRAPPPFPRPGAAGGGLAAAPLAPRAGPAFDVDRALAYGPLPPPTPSISILTRCPT